MDIYYSTGKDVFYVKVGGKYILNYIIGFLLLIAIGGLIFGMTDDNNKSKPVNHTTIELRNYNGEVIHTWKNVGNYRQLSSGNGWMFKHDGTRYTINNGIIIIKE